MTADAMAHDSGRPQGGPDPVDARAVGLPVHVLVGPPDHGVTLLARQLADGLGAPVREFADHAELHARLGELAGLDVHAHVTDHLFGDTPARAAELIEHLAARTAWLGVTLHDIPQPSDGPERFARRARAYRAVARAANLVIVSSRHERSLLAEARIAPECLVDELAPVAVVPLPIVVPGAAAQAPASPLSAVTAPSSDAHPAIGIFGYVYPGKGYEEAITAAARVDPPARVVALGAIARGHDWLASRLHALASSLGVRFEITGFIADAELPARLAEIDVPLVWHRHFSASGSLNSWIAAGRRPLTVDARYSRERADAQPGTLTLVADDEDALAAAIREALSHSSSTHLDAAARERVSGSFGDTLAAHRALFARRAEAAPTVSVVIPFYDDGTELPQAPADSPAAAAAAAGDAAASHAGPAQPRTTLARERLRCILAALAADTTADPDAPSFEVIVADDGSPAGEPRWAAAQRPSAEPAWPLPFTVVAQPDRGFRAGAARNLGAASARGEVLAFLDGDTVPEPGYLRALTRSVLTGEADLVVGRRTHRHITRPWSSEPLEDPAWLADAYERTADLAAADESSYRFVISAVLGVRASTLAAIGGFDETMQGYGGEDWELAHRAWQAGARLRHERGAVAAHDGADWAGRAGRSDASARATKSAEAMALAERIPAAWARPHGVRFALPELTVDLRALADGHPSRAELVSWISRLLVALPDCVVWSPEVPPVLAADGRVHRVARGVGDGVDVGAGADAAENLPPRGRWHLAVTDLPLPTPSEIAAAMRRLDGEPENGPHGGAARRAIFTAASTNETVGELASARAEALRAGVGRDRRAGTGAFASDSDSDSTALAQHPLRVLIADDDPGEPDLEREWAGW